MRCICRIEPQNEMTTLGLKLNDFFSAVKKCNNIYIPREEANTSHFVKTVCSL